MKETSETLTQQTLWDISTSTCSQVSARSLSALSGQDTQVRSKRSRRASHANPIVWLGAEKAQTMRGIFGPRSSVPFVQWDPSASFWRMSLGGFLVEVAEGLKAYAYKLQILGHRIEEKGSSLWPTPTVIDSGSGRVNQSNSPNAQERPSLALMARKRRWPTPAARDYRGAGSKEGYQRRSQDHQQALNEEIVHGISGEGQGQLNPAWVETLMGFPPGWTDLSDGQQDQENPSIPGRLPEPSSASSKTEQSA